jgi:hypothetical protein
MPERNFIPTPEKPKEKFPNVDADIAKNLEQIDFPKLKNLFLQKITSFGLNPEEYQDKFVSKGENFKNSGRIKGSLSKASYSKGMIAITKDSFEEFKKSNYVRSSDNKEQEEQDYILHQVAHEETHALSFGSEPDFESFSDASRTGQSGYATLKMGLKYYVLPTIEFAHRLFNEAVTETITREIFSEYSQRELSNEMLSYSSNLNRAVTVFDSICKKIGSECGIEEDILRKVIMRGYFAGQDLSGDKIVRLFKNVFPEDFEQTLKKMKVIPWLDDIQNITDLIEQSVWTDQDKKRIRRWITSIYNSMPVSQKK